MSRCVISLSIAVLPCLNVRAQPNPPTDLAQCIHKVYSSDEGLPQNRSRALIQTFDGYLWIGTQDGLARFDGASFQVFDKDNTPALKHNDITTLYEAQDSTLWIGTFNGLTKLKKGIFTAQPINTGPVRGIASDRAGTLWIGTMSNGIYQYRDGRYDSITTKQGLADNSTNTLTVDYQGNVWVAISGLGLDVFRNGQWIFYDKKSGFPSTSVRSFCVGSDSSVWIGTENGLVQWKHDTFHTYTSRDGLPDNIIPSLFQDRTGALWIGTERGGICRLKDNVFRSFGSVDGLSGDYVNSILEDREGSLWVGTFNGGVNQFWKGKFFNYTARDGIPQRTVRGMFAAPDGSVWIGTEGAGVLRRVGQRFLPVLRKELPSDYIRSLFQDSRGALWIGIREGLARYQDGKVRVFTTNDGLSQNFIRAVAEDHEGHIWAGTYNNGVNRLENGRFVDYRKKGILANSVRSLLVDNAGGVWVGSIEGLFRWHNGRVTRYSQDDGLPPDPIFDMIEDSERTIWLGSYGGGLVRIKDDKITRYTFAHGLPNDVVLKVLEDDCGNLWLSSMKGIGCVSKRQLNDFADGTIDRIQCVAYNSSDGMIVSECTGPTGCKTRDGFLWFPTSRGIVVIDPQNVRRNSLPPPVVIEHVAINGKDCSTSENVRVQPGEGRVEVHYGGLSFLAPQKVKFRYMLAGFETEWRFVGTRREAYYTNLAPGKYIFRVTACNSDGLWNEMGANFAFELEPHFYQTYWFAAFSAICIGGVVFGIYRLRVWQLLRREKMLERRVLERTAELEAANKELEAFSYTVSHDLRAPLRTIDGFSEALLEDYADRLDEAGKDYLRRARAASQHMEGIIDALLKLSRVARSDLSCTDVDLSALAAVVATRLQAFQPERRVEFSIEPGLIVRADENLMQIVMENLLNNAWKFTGNQPVAKIELRSVLQDEHRVYCVRDNGVGFDMTYAHKLFGAFQRLHSSAEFEGTGVGLATVQRILHKHGGRIWAEASAGQGASFYFSLPE